MRLLCLWESTNPSVAAANSPSEDKVMKAYASPLDHSLLLARPPDRPSPLPPPGSGWEDREGFSSQGWIGRSIDWGASVDPLPAVGAQRGQNRGGGKEMKARASQNVSLTNHIIPRHLQSCDDTTSSARSPRDTRERCGVARRGGDLEGRRESSSSLCLALTSPICVSFNFQYTRTYVYVNVVGSILFFLFVGETERSTSGDSRQHGDLPTDPSPKRHGRGWTEENENASCLIPI